MITFMDYIVRAFETNTRWDFDNSYSALTATSDALLAFHTPSTLNLNVSSLSTANFASSYTLSTLGQIDGLISYLYTSHPLDGIASQTPSIPLRSLVRGYRDLKLPRLIFDQHDEAFDLADGRKPTLLYASLALPPPSTLMARYIRRVDPRTLVSLSLYSKSLKTPSVNNSAPSASVLAHVQHDTGRFSVEGEVSSDSALIGVRGLWNFGLFPFSHGSETEEAEIIIQSGDGTPELAPALRTLIKSSQDDQLADRNRLASKPSLLSAGAEFYYSPFSHLIGMSTGLRFTTLAPHITPGPTHTSSSGKPLAGTSASLLTPSNIAHSSFPYTMTLTLNPLVGSIASTYSVRPTPNLALSSRCDFNFYSWESQYVVGAELWRGRGSPGVRDQNVAWAKEKLKEWFTAEERTLKEERLERAEENVLKVRVDDSWNFRASWTGRVKALLVTAGVSVQPLPKRVIPSAMETTTQKWTGSVGMSVAYST